MNLTVPFGIPGIPCQLECEKRRDDRFVVRPPEFHVVPVFLDGQVLEVAEIKNPAMLPVPTPFPHPVEDGETQLDESGTVSKPALVHDEPGAFDGVAGIEESAIKMVEDLPVRADGLHECPEIRLEEVFFDLFYGVVDPSCASAAINHPVSKVGTDFLGRHNADHMGADSLLGSGRLKFWLHHPGGEAVAQVGGETFEGFYGGSGFRFPIG